MSFADRERPGHPMEDWIYEVRNGDTLRGYDDWCDVRDEMAADDDDDNICRSCGKNYPEGGDGYDGECPDCADKTEALSTWPSPPADQEIPITIEDGRPCSVIRTSGGSAALRGSLMEGGSEALHVLEGFILSLTAAGFPVHLPLFLTTLKDYCETMVDELTEEESFEYEVLVGNIGSVYTGNDAKRAHADYDEYVKRSKSGYGKAGGEPVSLWQGGEPIKEFTTLTAGPSEKVSFPNGMEVMLQDDGQLRVTAAGLGLRAITIHPSSDNACRVAPVGKLKNRKDADEK